MINDILEQITEDYFRSKGYFTQHNVKYRPRKKGPEYAVHSDVDFVGIHPHKTGKKRVVVASCKAWHTGLNIKRTLKRISEDPKTKEAGREIWKKYREIVNKIWAEAFKNKIFELTGQKEFEFYLVVTKYKGNKKDWQNFSLFRKNLKGCDIKLIDMKTMLLDVYERIGTTPAHSELSRLLQLIKADNGKIIYERKN